MKAVSIIVATLLLTLILTFSGCSTGIGLINSDTPKYENEVVTINGDVTESFWFDFLNLLRR